MLDDRFKDAFFDYSTSSFAEILQRAAPHLLPGRAENAADEGGMPSVPHGTTVLALRYRDGVIMAGDRQASEGYQVAHRRIEKIFKSDDLSGVGIAGAAGPAMEMARLFQTELEHYEKVEGENLSLDGKANKLGQMIRMNLPMAMQGLVVVPIFAGFDERAGVGRLFPVVAVVTADGFRRLPDDEVGGFVETLVAARMQTPGGPQAPLT